MVKAERNYITCPVCGKQNCNKHCNNCGKSIKIRKGDDDKWYPYEDGTDIIHKGCHKEHTKSGKYLDVNNKKYECVLFREDDFNRYFLTRINGKINRVIEKKEDWQKMTPQEYTNSLKKFVEPKEWQAWTYTPK